MISSPQPSCEARSQHVLHISFSKSTNGMMTEGHTTINTNAHIYAHTQTLKGLKDIDTNTHTHIYTHISTRPDICTRTLTCTHPCAQSRVHTHALHIFGKQHILSTIFFRSTCFKLSSFEHMREHTRKYRISRITTQGHSSQRHPSVQTQGKGSMCIYWWPYQ